MGAVYQAWDRDLEREVAIKVVLRRPEGVQLERFRREGQLAAALRHPGIVCVHETGDLAGSPFLVCELVHGGRTLDRVLPGLDLRGRIRLVLQVARALGHAHAQRVIHRDVKPGNIIVGADGRARLADFGLATALGLSRLTLSGAFVGTPTHMAPEQLKAERDRIGPHTDVWALGVILYWALTDTVPFKSATLLSRTVEILEGNFLRPREVKPSIPPALETVCVKALQTDGRQRYPTGDELADDLEAWLKGRACVVKSPGGRAMTPLAGAAGLLLAVAMLLQTRDGGDLPALEATAAIRPRATATAFSDPSEDLQALLGEDRLSPVALEAWAETHPTDPQASVAREKARRNRLRALTQPLWSVGVRNLEIQHPNVCFLTYEGRQQIVVKLSVRGRHQFLRWEWDGRLAEARSLPPWPPEPMYVSSWDATGSLLAVLGPDSTCTLVDLRESDPRTGQFPVPEDTSWLALSPRGVMLALSGPAETLVLGLRGLQADGTKASLSGLADLGLSFSPDGRRLAALSASPRSHQRSAELLIWEPPNPEPARSPAIPFAHWLQTCGDGWVVNDDGHRLFFFEGQDAAQTAVLSAQLHNEIYGANALLQLVAGPESGFVLGRRSVLRLDGAARSAGSEHFKLADQGQTYRGFAIDSTGNYLALTVLGKTPATTRVQVWLAPRD